MKLIVQIPCYNEEETLAETVADIPRTIEGIDTVEVLIIDDGSTDRTIETALACGVDHIVRHKINKGLAASFATGLDACLRLGADVIVNTDGDHQYPGDAIPLLVEPIVQGRADIVISNRNTQDISHFSPIKKLLQKFGSAVVRLLSGLDVPDAVSGFRSYSRETALRTNVLSEFSYTVETIIQSGMKKLAVESVSIQVNPEKRDSRLAKSTLGFVFAQMATIIRTYAMYKPMRLFFSLGAFVTIAGLIPVIRFVVYYFLEGGDGHIQSLTLGSALLVIGFMLFVIGLLGDLIGRNRIIAEETLLRTRRIELDKRP